MARHPRWTRALFTEAELDALTEAVGAVERQTSAELRVHLERRVPGHHDDALARARDVFAHLGMHRTAARNGVLIYLAIADHKLAIVGDEGIHARVGDGYWGAIRDAMVGRLREGRPGEALVRAIADVGRVLAEHFPRRPDDIDELGNEVSIR